MKNKKIFIALFILAIILIGVYFGLDTFVFTAQKSIDKFLDNVIKDPANTESYKGTNFSDSDIIEFNKYHKYDGYIFNTSLSDYSFLSKTANNEYIYKLTYKDGTTEEYKFNVEKKGFNNYLINLDNLYINNIKLSIPELFNKYSINIKGLDYDLSNYAKSDENGIITITIPKVIKLDNKYTVTISNESIGKFNFDIDLNQNTTGEIVSSILTTENDENFHNLINISLIKYYDSAFSKVSATEYCKTAGCADSLEQFSKEYEKVSTYAGTRKISSADVYEITDIGFSSQGLLVTINGSLTVKVDGHEFGYSMTETKLTFKFISGNLYIVDSVNLPTEFNY